MLAYRLVQTGFGEFIPLFAVWVFATALMPFSWLVIKQRQGSRSWMLHAALPLASLPFPGIFPVLGVYWAPITCRTFMASRCNLLFIPLFVASAFMAILSFPAAYFMWR